MNNGPRIEEKNSITFEVIRYITLYYFTVAIFLTLSQVVLEYFQIKRNIVEQITEIEESFSESLTNSLWEFNDVQTKAIVDGIAKTPSIMYAEARGPEGRLIYGAGADKPTIREKGGPLFFDPSKVFVFEKRLFKNTEDLGREHIGSLTIYSGNAVIFEQLSHIVFSIVINSIIKTIFLWAILLIFFNNRLKTPLDEFVTSIAGINPKNPTPVDLKISNEILEFSRIQNAFNNLINQLRNYKEVLEAIVENKTELLKEKNEEVAHLINELNDAQTQILKQEKLTSLGMLSAGIAHELKNPLNLSKNTALMIEDVIEERKDLDPEFKAKIKQFIKIAVDSNDRMNHIIQNMLVQARIQNSDYSDINLKNFIDTNYQILLKSNNKNAKTDIVFENKTDEDIVLQVQANDFGRLLANLFENSTHSIKEKAESEGPGYIGVIRVSTEVLKEKESVAIEFWDNGSGIEQKDIDKIMEPFFTTKPSGSGTGLGLYLTYEIVEQHKGKIDIESEKGEYALFRIELPMKQNPGEHQEFETDGAP